MNARSILCLLFLLSLSASASVLMRESFPIGSGGYTPNASIYNKGPDASETQFGFAPKSKWENDTGVFWAFTQDRGLQFPSTFPPSQFLASGSSAGLIRSEKNQNERAIARALEENLLVGHTGTLYFRCLITMNEKAMNAYTGEAGLNTHNYFGIGLQRLNGKPGNSTVRSPARGISFFYVKDENGVFTLNLALRGVGDTGYTLYPLVIAPTPGETYLCFAEIEIGTGIGGADRIRAFAAPCSTYVIGAIDYSRSIGNNGTVECKLMSDTAPLNYLGLGGAYGVNSGFAAVDEIAVATLATDLIPVSATAPVLANPTIARTGATEFTVSSALSQGVADVIATLENGVDAPIVLTLGANATPASGTVSAVLPDSLTLESTYKVTVSASNNDGSDSVIVGFVYLGTPTAENMLDANEYNYQPGYIRVSRAEASPNPLTILYSVTPDDLAVEGRTYRPTDGFITIPADETSALVPIVPMYDKMLTQDSVVTLSIANGLYYPGSSDADLVISNAVPPAEYNTFISKSGNTLGGRASEAGNWSYGRVPVETDHILVDGFFSDTVLNWDAGVNGLPNTVASWTQTTNSQNSVVFYTTYPEYDESFTCFTITGDCRLEGGRWNHRTNSTSQQYRLCVSIGGDLLMGPAFVLSTYDTGLNPGSYTEQSAPGSHASSMDGWSHVTGDVYRPRDIGSGWSNAGSGGGAVWLEVAGNAVINSTIACRCSGRGAAGSFYLKAASLSGTGSIGVNGGTSGGRIGIELTEATTLDFPIDKFNLSGVLNTSTPLAVGGGGTLVVKTANQQYGTLYLSHSRAHQNGRWPSKFEITAIPPNTTWTFDAIVIREQGMLAIPPTTTLRLPNGLASVSGYSKQVGGLLYAGGTLDIGTGDQELIGNPTDSTLGWVFQADTPYTFPGNVTIRNGAAIGAMGFSGDPDLTDPDHYARCCVTVQGNLTVEKSGFLYAKGGGPDFCSETAHITGFGGQPALAGNVNLSYGSVFNPTLPGYGNTTTPSSKDTSPGGGALQLTVLGDFILNGNLNANAETSIGSSRGSGGSVNIVTATLSGTGSISANSSKPTSNSVHASGGGGRIAIRLTQGEIGTDGVWSKISAAGFSNNHNGSREVYKDTSSSAGTVYLQGASQAEGTGTLIIANDGYVNNDLSFTPLPSGRWTTDRNSDYRLASLEVRNNARIRLFDDLSFGDTTIEPDCAFDVAGYSATFRSLTLADGEPLDPGTYAADDPRLAGLFLDSSPDASGHIIVTAPATLILFR